MQRSPILLLLFMSLLAIASHAQVTSLTLISDADDFVGQGRTMFFTPFSGSIFANQNTLNGVSVSFSGTNFESWNLNFAAPDNQLLTVGTYNGAVLYPTQGPGTPGLSVFGDGRGCAAITGSFVVQEITYGVFFPLIDSFDATFEQHCDGLSSAIRGEIRYNAHPFVNVSAPSPFTVTVNQSVSFTVSAADPASHHIALTASGLPDGANFVDNGNNTGTFNWTPLANQTGVHTVVFLGDNLSGNIGTTGLDITVIPPPPPNDDFDQATVAPAVPFSITEDVSTSTTAPDDPFPTCFPSRNQTVWFAFTPTQNTLLEVNTLGSDYPTMVSVYTGTRGALTSIACNFNFPSNAVRVRFDAVAGTTYFFMVSAFFPVSSANLVFNLVQAPPPLTISPGIDQFGSIDPSAGTASISGTASCSKPALFAFISGKVTQKRGNSTVTGFFDLPINCGESVPWSAVLQAPLQLFHGRSADLFTGGKAEVTAVVVGFGQDDDQAFQANFDVPITFRSKN